MKTGCTEQLTFWKIGKQEVTADFQGGEIVSDAGLVGVRAHLVIRACSLLTKCALTPRLPPLAKIKQTLRLGLQCTRRPRGRPRKES